MLKLKSPAKINLFLQVLKKRPDGYHELASLLQTVSLYDTLHFELSSSDHLTCNDPTTCDKNLVFKAVQLFRKKTGLIFGIRTHLEKRIPAQAGLGGGSSNAATTLWALNHLMGYPAENADLIKWSGEIGSDIPFFLSEGTAYCTGKGEVLQFLPPLEPQSLWIVKPKAGTSTPVVYSKLNIAQLPQRDPKIALQSFLEGKPCYSNDLETPAFAVLPELAEIKRQLLQEGFSTVLLSGSGSSFFCMGLPPMPHVPNCQVFSAKFINRERNKWYE
jgi:4-diphosphocytidyl-2-C-methyl-D-erythritol kinase